MIQKKKQTNTRAWYPSNKHGELAALQYPTLLVALQPYICFFFSQVFFNNTAVVLFITARSFCFLLRYLAALPLIRVANQVIDPWISEYLGRAKEGKKNKEEITASDTKIKKIEMGRKARYPQGKCQMFFKCHIRPGFFCISSGT